MSAIPTQTTQGYQPPINVQYSVFLDNRCGKLLALIEALDASQLEVVAFSVLDATDHAVVRIITSNHILAKRLLERHNFTFSQSSVLIVELRGQQTMRRACADLLAAEISINYSYALHHQPHSFPLITIHTEDITLAGQILLRKHFVLLAENDLGSNATNGDPYL